MLRFHEPIESEFDKAVCEGLEELARRVCDNSKLDAYNCGEQRHMCDTLVDGVSVHKPGSKGRVADLAAFYNIAERFNEPPSPFNI